MRMRGSGGAVWVFELGLLGLIYLSESISELAVGLLVACELSLW